MELLFNEEERYQVNKRFGIDLEEYVDKLVFLEEVDDINVFSAFREHIKNVSVYMSTLKQVESRIGRNHYQPYSSLLYYFREWKKACDDRLSDEEQNVERAVSSSYFFRCSAYNYLCYLVYEACSNPASKTILAFEACPFDLNTIKSRYELLNIKNLARQAGVNSLLVFATNANAFKYTCSNYNFDYLHFAGHGYNNGSPVFMGSNGKSDILSFSTFENYFSTAFVSSHPGANIISCYINSCYSDFFVSHIHRSPLISPLFDYKIGHIAGNSDRLAIESSEIIYDQHFNNSQTIKDSFDYAKDLFDASMSTDKNTYASRMTIYH